MPTFIKPCYGYLNSFYGPRVHPITKKVGTFHRGIDYTGASDESIFAAAAGKVRFVDASPTRTGFGKYIIITHDNGYETVYAHLSSVNVKVGQRVSQGQKIGVKGTTGNSTGMHLHFEMSKGRWNNKYTTNVNPLPFIDDPEIRTVQAVLKEIDLYKGAIDGIHGSSSIAAVKAFQKKNGMGADGVPGRGTMAAIQKEKERLESKDWLEYDDRGEEVEALQKYLSEIGFPVIINGHYSADTRMAVMAFQLARGLKPDGVYGKGSKNEMNKVLKEPKKPAVKPAAKPTSKEEEKLELSKRQREEIAATFAKARERKVFSSEEHEEKILNGRMTQSELLYLNNLIAGAALIGGKRVN